MMPASHAPGRPALRLLAVILAGMAVLAACARTQEPVTLTVSAAANVTPVLRELGPRFEAETGVKLAFNFGATTQLAQQIERGAPVDVFVAANTADVDRLEGKGLILDGTNQPYAIGTLAMWVGPGAGASVVRVEDLARPEIARIAIANPERAPYGLAAKEAMQATAIWEVVQPKLVIAENVSQALQYAETGNVDVAFVALSLVTGKSGTTVEVAETLHRPIVQSLGIVAATPHPEEARRFVDFLTGAKGQELLREYGYREPGAVATP